MREEYRERVNEIEKKFYAVMDEMTEKEIEEMAFCRTCPLKKECNQYELYFGCGVWEAMMGDDL